MFIELAEYLRCPERHTEAAPLVVAPDVMEGRDVRRGVVGCPICRGEYPITDGIVDFGGRTGSDTPDTEPALEFPPVDVLHALLGLAGPGGYVVALGSAGTLAPALAERLGAVHTVAVNAPAAVLSAPGLSLVRCAQGVPLVTEMARGVVVGAEATPQLLEEARRIVLRGLRVVVCRDHVVAPGLRPLAAGEGLWVGQKE